MSLADRFFAFFNGMVAGMHTFIQVGHRSLLCSLSKLLKFDFRLSLRMLKFITELLIA